MNSEVDVVVGWPVPLEEGEDLGLEDLASKIGGEPLWLQAEAKEDLPSLKCEKCGKDLKFLLQMYAPLDNVPEAFHRYLYVFLCLNMKTCSNTPKGIYLFRSQLPEKNPILDFDIESGEATLLNPISLELPSTALVKEVSEIATEMMSPAKQQDILDQEDDEDEVSEEDEEAELKDHTYKIFKRFDKATPSNVVRYCFDINSKPLFYSDYGQFEVKNPKACEHCGAPRFFEFQINVQILSVVKPLVELDWGIVALYSCSKSCTVKDQKYVRELVEVQIAPEEIDKLNMKRLQERKLKEFQKDMEDNGQDVPLEEEIAMIEEQIKMEEEIDHQEKKAKKSKAKTGNEEMIEEKKGKLFESEGSEDDWA
jgi:pre-rRNA-processing protein TSR4